MQGIVKVTKGDADLIVPPNTPEGEVWRYGLAVPFQVAPRKAALFVNIRKEYMEQPDFEAGTDIVLFDDLSKIRADGAIPVSRNHKETNPFTNEPSTMVKYPVIGGFVPLGAKRTDGSLHPHAGTGFGVSQVISFPSFQGKPYQYSEIHQFSYDGETFRVLKIERIPYGQILSGWNLQGPGMTNAIPDGDDLIFAMTDADQGCSGVTRWRRDDKGWHPTSFSPMRGTEGTGEPSLIRDVDGALLFSVRWGSRKEVYYDVRVWRSIDGVIWTQVVNARRIRSESPVSINQAADGTPYVAANLHQEPYKDSRGVWSYGRETLCIWPLNAERNGLEPGIVARPCRADFGPPPDGSYWHVDHPSATTLQLVDGAWHNVLTYRILSCLRRTGDLDKETYTAGSPIPQVGCYVEEVISTGKPVPAWTF